MRRPGLTSPCVPLCSRSQHGIQVLAGERTPASATGLRGARAKRVPDSQAQSPMATLIYLASRRSRFSILFSLFLPFFSLESFFLLLQVETTT